eukprot:363768-Chlamydomonas_euryale.AAC.2
MPSDACVDSAWSLLKPQCVRATLFTNAGVPATAWHLCAVAAVSTTRDLSVRSAAEGFSHSSAKRSWQLNQR